VNCRNRYAIGGISIAAVAAQEAMAMLHRVWIVVIVTSAVIGFCHAWAQRSSPHPQHAFILPIVDGTTSVLDAGNAALHARVDDWAEPQVDLNGNEIDAAVGDYRVDKGGEMYERHAPDTALLHLSAPEL
jgi:hypothetical protein